VKASATLAMQDDSDIRPYTDPCAGMVWCAMFPGDVSLGGQGLEGLQNFLGLMGLVPGAGEFADAANALIYAIRGDMVNAGLSVAAMLPIGGQAVFFSEDVPGQCAEAIGNGRRRGRGQVCAPRVPEAVRRNNSPTSGLDVNDPRFGVIADGAGSRSSALRDAVQRSVGRSGSRDNPNATADDALNFARKLAGKYGFSFNP
jgi:hypothetical protein